MDTRILRSTLTGFALATTLAAPIAQAHAPDVTIVEPSGTHTVNGFPTPVTVKLKLSHINPNNASNCQLDSIQNLTVSARHADDDDHVVILPPVDPALSDDPTLPFCTAYYSFTWQVPKAGSYDLLVSTRHGGCPDCSASDTETDIEFFMLSVEYPAPPAVANAYINSTPHYKSAPGKKRGCIISKIAEKHAKMSDDLFFGYGPKGGPYDEDTIMLDVDNYYLGGYGC